METGSVTEAALPPEVRYMIADCFGDDHDIDQTLLSLIRVNRSWLEAGVRVIWHHAPLYVLPSSAPPHRSRIYHEAVKTVDGLESMSFQTSMFIMSHLPNVSHLELGLSNFDDIQPQHVIHFLQSCKSLRSLVISDYKNNTPIAPDVLAFLSDSKDLEGLRIKGYLQHDKIENTIAFTKTKQLFCYVRSLRLHLQPQSVKPMLAAAHRLTQLTLKINNEHELHDDKFYFPASSMPLLVKLDISFRREKSISAGEMLALSSLRMLRNLRIVHKALAHRTSPISGDVFTRWISNFPDLRTLDFCFKMVLPQCAVISIGRSCPNLKRLKVRQDFDLCQWEHEIDPVFPKLDHLSLREFVDTEKPEDLEDSNDPDNSDSSYGWNIWDSSDGSDTSDLSDQTRLSKRASLIARHLAKHTPKLRYLECGKGKVDLIKAVRNAWRALKAPDTSDTPDYRIIRPNVD